MKLLLDTHIVLWWLDDQNLLADEDDRRELYNLRTDPGEKHNLAERDQ